MKKILLFVFLVAPYFVVFGSTRVDLKVKYSEAVDVFEFVDNLSQWSPNCHSEYRSFFSSKGVMTDADMAMLHQYSGVRKKYLNSEEEPQYSAFSTNRSIMDPISDAFYQAKDVDHALEIMQKKVDVNDVKIIAETLKHFKERLVPYITESKMFGSALLKLETELRNLKLKKLSLSAAKFLNLNQKAVEIKYYFVWWPSDIDSQIDVAGDSIRYRINPLLIQKIKSEDVITPTMRILSSLQSEIQKQNLEKLFFSICPIKKSFRAIDLLENTLLLSIGDMPACEIRDRKDFTVFRDWSVNPWINFASKSIYPTIRTDIKERRNINDGVIQKLGTLCQEINVVHQFIKE